VVRPGEAAEEEREVIHYFMIGVLTVFVLIYLWLAVQKSMEVWSRVAAGVVAAVLFSGALDIIYLLRTHA
jgi:hypothetical protein